MKNKKLNTKFQTLKSNHAITLIALIITIVVMLILVAVTLSIALGENGVINNAKEAKEKQALGQKEEEIISHFSLDYYQMMQEQYNNGKTLDESTVKEMAQLCIDTGISPDKLTVHYNLYSAKQNETNGNNDLKEEIVLYRIDKVTAEERTILEEKGVKALKGDATQDGYLTQADIDKINPLISDQSWMDDEYLSEACDITGDGWVDAGDSSYILVILDGVNMYEGG